MGVVTCIVLILATAALVLAVAYRKGYLVRPVAKAPSKASSAPTPDPPAPPQQADSADVEGAVDYIRSGQILDRAALLSYLDRDGPPLVPVTAAPPLAAVKAEPVAVELAPAPEPEPELEPDLDAEVDGPQILLVGNASLGVVV